MVSVVLSTYNGEDYLLEQLDSIFTQSRPPDRILVRDDGSTDSTIEILKAVEPPVNIELTIIQGDNVGVRESFFNLLEMLGEVPGQVVFFADQDDVWLPEKMEKTLARFQELDEPQLISCRYISWIEAEGQYHKEPPVRRLPNPDDSLLQNLLPGCTMAFNEQLRCLLIQSKKFFTSLDPTMLHDWIAYLLAAQFGRVSFLDEHLIQYRQHANNQVGATLSGYKKYSATVNKFLSLKIYSLVLGGCRMVLKVYDSGLARRPYGAIGRIKALRSLLEGNVFSYFTLLALGFPRRQNILGSFLFYLGIPVFFMSQFLKKQRDS